MGTFVYAPGIRIYIDTEMHGVLDVSDDIVDYTVQRRSDGPSTLNFSLQNVRRKYDQVFAPNDRIVVELKRVTWLRVFTGLLNSVPLLTAWPRVVAFSASCSLKRLQYWYWDPELATSYMTVIEALGSAQKTSDTGMTNAILTLLKEVVGWPENKVHIGAIPPNWFELVRPYAEELANELRDADEQVLSMMSTAASGSVGGTTTGSVGSTASGSGLAVGGIFNTSVNSGVNGEVFEVGALRNAEALLRVGYSYRDKGVSDNDILAALIAAMGESRLQANPPSLAGSTKYVGMFQQSPGFGGIPPNLRTDPIWASRGFFNRAISIKNRSSMSPSRIAAEVQGYWRGTGSNSYAVQSRKHDPFLNCANDLLIQFKARADLGAITGSPSSTAAATQATSGAATPSGKRPAEEFLGKALQLVATYPNVPYGAVNQTNNLRSNPPPAVGCSGFISWVLMQLTGSLPNGWPLEQSWYQYQWCLKNGGKNIPVSEAIKTKGALLVRKPPPGDVVGHIEMSVGDGVRSVGAQQSDTDASVHKGYFDQYTHAVLMPLFDYSSAQNGAPPLVYNGVEAYPGGSMNAGLVPYSESEVFNSDSVIDQLFGGLIAPSPNQDSFMSDRLATAFSGPRAMLNDQPFLPYIKNLVNASMRSFCSAPNGDFMAWFPDYYGLWGSAAIMVIEPIELLDFYVEWSDDFMVTHQYAVAGTVNYIDGFSGRVETSFGDPAAQLDASVMKDNRVFTAGVASIDIPAIMWALFGMNVTKAQAEQYAQWVYKRFGARPDFKEMDGLVGKAAEMFSAMYYFMRQWAYQYNSNIPLTFMPELWPGMLVQIPEYDFQAYVTAVTHTGQMGEGGGHSTSINIAAPARLPKPGSKSTQNLMGLPVATGMLQTGGNPIVLNPEASTRGNQAQVDKNAAQEGRIS